ncbi:MAG: metalloregulator ArsR/SmtB family transcription factor [Myxococcota bacterium]
MLESHEHLDKMFHALADRSRRAMLDRLTRGPATVSELAEPFDCTLAAIVQHVKVLEAGGLVRTEKIGRSRTCRLDTAGVARAERWLQERRQLWSDRFDRLGEILERTPDTPGGRE